MRRCALALFAALALPAFGAVPTVQITGNVLAPDLSVPTSGKVTCKLSEPGTAMDGAVAQRVAAEATFTLGSGGALPGTAKIVSNSIISPSGTVYSCLYSIVGANGRAKSWTETWQVPSVASIAIGDIPLVRTGTTSTVNQVVGAVPTLTASANSGSVGVKLNSGAGICLNADANPPCTVRLYYDPATGNVVTGGAPTYTPESSCTYVYSAWGTCQSAGTQTRTVVTATPNGCTGTPILSQACTYNAPTCTSWTYSDWAACTPTNTQTRTVLTSSPTGCEGGSPALSQTCTYNPVTPPGGDAIAHCATDPRRTTGGVTYYVCNCDAGAQAGCVAGDDSYSGTSSTFVGGTTGPLRSFSAAQAKFRSMNAGDTVAFCKGGSWVGVSSTAPHWTNANCLAPTTAGDWTSASTAGRTCDVRNYSPTWGGTNLPYIDIATNAIDFYSGTGTHGYRFQGINWHGRSGTYGLYTNKRNVSDVLICANAFDGFNVAISPMIDRLYVVSNDITHSTTQGFIGGTNYGRIEGNTFSDCGTAVGHHCIYLGAGITDGGTSVTVRGNRTTRSSMSGGRCVGSHIVAHGQFDALLIEGNNISEADGIADQACFGIDVRRDSEVPDGTVVPEYFRNVTIRGNTIKWVGNTAIALANAQNVAVENNLVWMSPTIGGTAVKHQSNYGPQSGANGTDDDIKNVFIRNNTVYGTAAAPAGVRFERAGLGGHEVYNNAFYLVAGTCVGENSGITYNAYNGCATTANSTWFVSAGTDFTPGAASPLLNAGTTRSGQAPTSDITGKARDASPDIGAYESGSTAPGNATIVAQDGSGTFTTIQAAADAATAGATIRIKAGVYHEQVTITKSGTSTAPITIQGDDGVYIDGDADSNSSTLPTIPGINGAGMIAGSGISYVKFVNLNVRNVNGHGYRLSASNNITIQGGSVSYTQDGGIYFNTPSSYITIDGVDVHHTNQEGSTADSESISMSGTQHFEIKNCKVHDNGENAIDVKGNAQYGSVHNNDVYHNATMQTGATMMYVDQGLDIDIYANKFHDCGPANYCLGIGIEGWSTPTVAERIKVYNNLFYDVPNEAIGFWNNSTRAPNPVWTDIQIVNNVFYNVAVRAMAVNEPTSEFTGTNVFRNNLMWDVDGYPGLGVISGVGIPAFQVDHNLFQTGSVCLDGATPCTTASTASVSTADPLFTNAAAYDFSLQSGSAAVNAGSATLAPATDYAGTTRPTGAAVDIGAYER